RAVAITLATVASITSSPLRAEESTFVYAVQISAVAQTAPPQITLNWEPDPFGANSYTVYRKGKSDTSWGVGSVLPGSAVSYTDNNVVIGAAYEYQIVKAGALGDSGYGNFSSGMFPFCNPEISITMGT